MSVHQPNYMKPDSHNSGVWEASTYNTGVGLRRIHDTDRKTWFILLVREKDIGDLWILRQQGQ